MHCQWECKMVQALWKTVWQFLKNLKTELPYDVAISLLSIYAKELKAGTQNICTPMFIAALFTTAKTQVSTDGQMDKQMWSIHRWKMDEPSGHYAK